MTGSVASRPRRAAKAGGAALCAHCGLDVPSAMVRADDEEQFCCNGCRQVYHLLHDWGCQDFYRIRASQDAEGRTARPTGRSFEDFDDPSFRDEFVEATGRGTLRTRLYLEGVHCAACVWLVEELPRSVEGLVATRLNFANSIVSVEWDDSRTSLSRIAQALDGVGYVPHPHRSDDAEQLRRSEDRSLLIKVGVATACAMNIMFLHAALYAGEHYGMAPRFESFFRWTSFALAVPVVLFAARPFYRAAWAGLRQRVPHMDLPIALALSAAFAYSAAATIQGSGAVYFDSLAALVALLLGARYVQRRAQRAAVERAHSLRSIAFAEFARRVEPIERGAVDLADDSSPTELAREVPLSVLKRGDRVEVRSGELVPVDGRVVSGRSAVNNAALTGEPDPIVVEPGDDVHAGANNLGGRLVVEVAAAGADTRVGALLALVEDAMAKRAPIVQTADRLSRVFVLTVLALAAGTGLYWLQTSLGAALEQTVALLVVTCPCALGLATPVAMTVALARAARAGIFVKNPETIELLRHVDTIVLDKTGTITEGEATVSRWCGREQALELACAVEAQSSHAVAEALRRSHGQPMRLARPASEVREIPGQGISGWVDEQRIAVGNRALIDGIGAATPPELSAHASRLLAVGLSPLYVAIDDAVAAVGGVGDPLRRDAFDTIAALQQTGTVVHILSGDHPDVVARVAAQVGVALEDAVGGLSPEDKRDRLAQLVAERAAQSSTARRHSQQARVVMVGDGVNDAAAMALADVGIAVHGGAGASIAAADVVLTRPGLAPLLQVLSGARRTLWVVYRNLIFSLCYNAIGASLAIVGLVGPLLAAVLMPISSLTVILSSALARPFGRTPVLSPRRTTAKTEAAS